MAVTSEMRRVREGQSGWFIQNTQHVALSMLTCRVQIEAMPDLDPPPKTSQVWQEAMDQDLRDIGDRVRSARKAAGLSQTRLAGLMDVATNTIGGLENGRRATPVPLLKLIALHLGVDPRELLGGKPAFLRESSNKGADPSV